MSKERLEGAKKHLKGAITYFLIENDVDVKTIERVTGDIDLLIQQAERVQESEESVKSHVKVKGILADKLHASRKQNKRYREMLETVFQADDLEDVWNVEDDYRALESESE